MANFEKRSAAELADVDDWSSAWEECKEKGTKWGGRGFGGRATGRCTVQTRDVVLEGVTLSYLSKNLLDRTTLRLLRGRRYGLIGMNGVGKSTLMRRIATGTLPGFLSFSSPFLPGLNSTFMFFYSQGFVDCAL